MAIPVYASGLLQNALDALELRDLRLQFIKAGGQPAQPVDGVSFSPGHFTLTGLEEELEIGSPGERNTASSSSVWRTTVWV